MSADGHAIGVDDDAIYWIDDALHRTPKAGGTVEDLATVDATAGTPVIAIGADAIFWTVADSTVYALAKTGGSPTVLALGQDVSALGTDGESVYFAERAGLFKVDATGGPPTLIWARRSGGPLHFAIELDRIDLADENALTLARIGRDGSVDWTAMTTLGPHAIAAGYDDVYFTDPYGSVWHLNKLAGPQGGAPALLYVQDVAKPSTASAMVADAAAVFWSGPYGLERISATGGGHTIVDAAPPSALALDGRYVYYTAPSEGAVKRACRE